MNNQSLVSVVVPNYNNGATLERTLVSILEQSYKGGIEVIIVDGCSSDESIEIIKKYANQDNVTAIIEPDEGQADAINKGVRQSNGSYVTWLNSDDQLTPKALEIVMRKFSENDEFIMVYGTVINIHADGRFLDLNIGLHEPVDYLKYVDFIPQTGCVMRKKECVDIQLTVEYNWGLDWELWIKLSNHGKIACVDEILGYCITEGLENRKSDMISIKRTKELVGIQKKYCGVGNSHYIFGLIAIVLGYLFFPLGFIYQSYYTFIVKLTCLIHLKLFGRNLML